MAINGKTATEPPNKTFDTILVLVCIRENYSLLKTSFQVSRYVLGARGFGCPFDLSHCLGFYLEEAILIPKPS